MGYRKLGLWVTPAHTNWTTKDWWNVARSDIWVVVTVCTKQHENMDPSQLVSAVQAAAVMVRGIFFLSINWALFKHHRPTWVLCPIMSLYDHTASSRITHCDTKLRSSQTCFLIMTLNTLNSNNLNSPQISFQSHICCDVAELEIYTMDVQLTSSNCVMLPGQHGPNLWGMVSAACWIWAVLKENWCPTCF